MNWDDNQIQLSKPVLNPLGDSAVLIEFDKRIDPKVHQQVRECVMLLERQPFPGMLECVPAYASVTVHYDPIRVIRDRSDAFLSADSESEWIDAEKQRLSPSFRVMKYIEAQFAVPKDFQYITPRTVIIPVWYGGEAGPDLDEVSHHTGLSEEEVIREHAEQEYTVYMIGFSPGFPYLGGMSPRIAVPRRATPRTFVPAGSVGIAGGQTGVYPLGTPGGWQIIGRTPQRLFDPEAEEPSLLRAGDRIRFQPISQEQYINLVKGTPIGQKGGGSEL